MKKKSEGQKISIDTICNGLLYGLFVVFCLVSIIFILIREQLFVIHHVEYTGNQLLSPNRLDTAVSDIRKSNCSVMFNCNNGIWFPYYAVKQYLQQQFPRIENVKTWYTFSDNTLHIEIIERRMYSVWCTDTGYMNCYAVDQTGIIYERLPQGIIHIDKPVFVPDGIHAISALEGKTLPLQLWTRTYFMNTAALIDIISNFGSVGIVTYSDRDMNMKLITLYRKNINNNGYLKINRERVSDSEYREYVLKALDRFETYEPFYNKFSVDPMNFQYLDMRFMGRVYMKFGW